MEWIDPDSFNPREVEATMLIQSVHLIGVVCLLKEIWKKGSRHSLALALAGTLANADYSIELTTKLFKAVCRVSNDDELSDRIRVVKDTYKRKGRGEGVAGKRHLLEIAHSDILINEALSWLNIDSTDDVIRLSSDQSSKESTAELIKI